MPPPSEASHTFSFHRLNDIFERVAGFVQEAGNRQAAVGAAVGKNGVAGMNQSLEI
jgi:hypothetical protein